jgi:heme A synthase
MANRPVNTGSGGAAAPPPVHHDAAPAAPAGHRAARTARTTRAARAARDPRLSMLAWLPYLIVLAGAAAGMFVVWQGSKYAGRGAGLVGASLLAAALARLILPARYAGPLATRRKASDVLGFAVFGAAVLAVAIALP